MEAEAEGGVSRSVAISAGHLQGICRASAGHLQGICRASAGHREQEIDLQLLSRLAQPPVRDRV